MLEIAKVILVMTVNPGFAGQKLVPSTLPKIESLRRLLNEKQHPEIEIEVDGNVSFENAKNMRAAGADIFVPGSSSVFQPGNNLYDAVQQFRKVID